MPNLLAKANRMMCESCNEQECQDAGFIFPDGHYETSRTCPEHFFWHSSQAKGYDPEVYDLERVSDDFRAKYVYTLVRRKENA